MIPADDFQGRLLWDKVKGAWAKVAQSLRIRKNEGIVKLKRDVRTCEYEDVRILWEMLRKNDIHIDTYAMPKRRKKKRVNVVFGWSNCAPVLCSRRGAV